MTAEIEEPRTVGWLYLKPEYSPHPSILMCLDIFSLKSPRTMAATQKMATMKNIRKSAREAKTITGKSQSRKNTTSYVRVTPRESSVPTATSISLLRSSDVDANSPIRFQSILRKRKRISRMYVLYLRGLANVMTAGDVDF
jgi:hypothetical protein